MRKTLREGSDDFPVLYVEDQRLSLFRPFLYFCMLLLISDSFPRGSWRTDHSRYSLTNHITTNGGGSEENFARREDNVPPARARAQRESLPVGTSECSLSGGQMDWTIDIRTEWKRCEFSRCHCHRFFFGEGRKSRRRKLEINRASREEETAAAAARDEIKMSINMLAVTIRQVQVEA